MPAYTQYFNITAAECSSAVCLVGTCEYFPSSLPLGLYFLGFGHRVTLTFLASDLLPTRVGMYSDTSGEFAIDVISPTVGGTISHNFPLADTYVEFEFQAPGGFNFNVRLDYDAAPGETAANDFCAYGTRLKPAQQEVLVISGAAITLAIQALAPELFWLSIAFDALIGLTWVPGMVCSGPPPPIPIFDASDFLLGSQIPAPGSLGKIMQAWQAVNWGLYCECVPATGGAPAPVPFPNPTTGAPPAGGASPPAAIVCDGADLCTTLNELMRQVASINAQIALARADIQLIQRQGVPFGYLNGTVHSGLTGSGELAVSDILGLSVSFTIVPAWIGRNAADPQDFSDLGEISVGTADGWVRHFRLSHNPEIILGVSGVVTRVGYWFNPTVVADIRELTREP